MSNKHDRNKIKENVTLTLHFLLPLFDTSTWHVLSRVVMKEKTQLFFDLYWLPLSFCKGDFCHLPSKNVGQFERESITHTCVSGGMSKCLAQFK